MSLQTNLEAFARPVQTTVALDEDTRQERATVSGLHLVGTPELMAEGRVHGGLIGGS